MSQWLLPLSSTPAISIRDVEDAAIVAGYTFFMALSGFVTAGYFTGSSDLRSILLAAGISAGYAFFGKLYFRHSVTPIVETPA